MVSRNYLDNLNYIMEDGFNYSTEMENDNMVELEISLMTKVLSTKCTTYMIANNAVYIKKDRSKNGIIVFFEDKFNCVISTTKEVGGVPVILLLKENKSDLNVYQKWLHIVGKMIKKEFTNIFQESCQKSLCR